jgi:hypothetical protein
MDIASSTIHFRISLSINDYAGFEKIIFWQ